MKFLNGSIAFAIPNILLPNNVFSPNNTSIRGMRKAHRNEKSAYVFSHSSPSNQNATIYDQSIK